MNSVGSKAESPRLHRLVLLPALATLAALAILFVAGFYYHVESRDEARLAGEVQRVEQLWGRLRHEAEHQLEWVALQAAADPALVDAMRRGDSRALLDRTQGTYRELHTRFGISHWYFITPDRRVLLRVHNPEQSGDLVARDTFVESVETGKPVTGLDLGATATLTLRHILPWRADGKLIGYIEMGTEIGAFEPLIKQTLGVEILAAVHKAYTTAQAFDNGNRALDFAGRWDAHEALAVLNQSLERPPAPLFAAWQSFVYGQMPAGITKIADGGSLWSAGFLLLRDFRERPVASLAILENLDAVVAARRASTWRFAAVTLLAIALLSVTLAFVVRRIESRMVATRKQLLAREGDLAGAVVAAEQASLAKSALLATVSQEIRTPMNGILGTAQLLLSPALPEAERRECTRIILRSGQTLLTLVNDILEMSRIEAGKVELEIAAFDPAQVLRDVEALFREPVAAKRLAWRAAWHGEPGRQYAGDCARLTQMLSNFVGNAIRFTDQGEIAVEGRETGRDGGVATLEFVVSDTGTGIPPERLPIIFQPFSHAEASAKRPFGGSGLGLTITRSLARLMGGDVGVESESGRGSRFWFRVRLATDTQGADGAKASAGPSPLRIVPGSGTLRLVGRVLTVDDNPINRLVICKMLSRLGIETLEAENGQQALDAVAARERIDLVLMDIHMPGLDGYATTRRMRARETAHGHGRLPVIALTADALAEAHAEALASGMDDLLLKPVQLSALQSMLVRWLPAAPEAAAG